MMEKIKKSSTSLNIENERTIHRVKNIRVPHNTKVSCLRKQNFVRKYPTPWNFSTNVRPATSSEVPSTRFSNKYSCAPKRHYCPVCHKGFTWLCCLKRHMKIHSKFEKIYQCEECGYMTRRFKDFKAHQYKHRTGNYDPIRYYTCPVCDETFNWLCDLKSHMQKHNTHIRKKSKEVDQPALTLPSCLERIRTHFKKGHFKCFQCNKEFLNGKQLIRHINRVHGYPQSKSRKKE